MSLPSSANPIVPAQKQSTNVYTMMLMVALIAIITATVLLAMELKRFEPAPWWNAPKAPSVT
jgi:hypothetical protein